ncbi:MAG: hypothetical protein JSS32_03335 [Verrucomicrobia bacterium]|nr:hypothetical protein [Verrucomicrobiota bacterium]
MKKNHFIFILILLLIASVIYTITISHSLKKARGDISTISIDSELLKAKLAEEPPKWIVKQIEEDLAPYASGISKDLLDRAFRGEKISTYNLVRFSIHDRHLSFSHDEKHLSSRHFRELLACIKKLNELIELPDVDFIVSLQDGFDDNPDLGPCFVFAKKRGLDSLILVPDIKAMTGYGKLRNQIADANRQFSWENKREMAFWRGSTTGGYFTHAGWDSFARAKLVLLSKSHPGVIDARFHSVTQCEPGVREMMKYKGLVASSVKKEDHLRYKYLVDVDGNSCSYERYFWLLASNSLVIKQITPQIQWYYGALEPYKHFLPVKEDLSDLVEKIEWAKNHDKEARLMADEATRFTKENLTQEDTLVYLYHLLTRYARLF